MPQLFGYLKEPTDVHKERDYQACFILNEITMDQKKEDPYKYMIQNKSNKKLLAITHIELLYNKGGNPTRKLGA